jgi:PAS domain S-box-containing protein
MTLTDPSQEQRRLAALANYDILHTAPEQDFDDLTALTAQLCQTPIAMINLIDEHQQWSKAQYGVTTPPIPRDIAFCAHAIAGRTPLIIPDLRVDARFQDNPFVSGDPLLRFYAGAPLLTSDGYAVGTLSVFDYQPRQLDAQQQSALILLSRQVVAQLELRRHIKALELSRQELSANTSLLQAVMHGTADSNFVKDTDGRYVFMNEAGARLLGRTPDQVVGRQDGDLMEPPAVEAIAAHERDILRSGRHDVVEEHLTINGRSQIFLTSKDIYRTHEGAVGGIIGVAHDITERVEIERALWHSQQHMAGIVTLSTDAIISVDEQQRICLFNQAAEHVFGYKAADILGQPLDILIPAQRRAAHRRHIQAFQTELGTMHGDTERGILTGLRRDGSEFPLEGSISKITIDGAAIFTVCLRDLTERLRVEEQLRLLESAVRHTTQAVIVTTAELDLPGPEIVFVNAAFSAMTGYAEGEMLGKTPRILQGPDTDRAVLRHLREQLSRGQSFHGEAVNYRKDGSEYCVEWHAAPVFDDGRISHFVAVQSDVTERRAAESQLRESKDRLQWYAHRLQTMYEISQWVLNASSLETIAQGALTCLKALIPFSRAAIALYELKARRARTLALASGGASQPAAPDPQAWWEMDENVATMELMGPITPHAASLPPEIGAHGTTQGEVVLRVPLVAQEQILGSLTLVAEHREAFNDEHLSIAREVAGQLAVAIQDAQLLAQIQAGRNRLATLSRSLIEVQENERRHLARELHDEIGQALTAIKINLNRIDGPGISPPMQHSLDDTNSIVDHLLQQVRNLSLDLRPSMLDDLGLISTLRWYLDRQAQRSGIRVQFSGEEPELSISPSIATACFRIVQESITNSIRHARASSLFVEVGQRNDQLALIVQDNGIGFDPGQAREQAAAGRSFGLLGMQERAVLLGGQCSITSAHGAGTRIEASLPLGQGHLNRRRFRR